MKLTVEDKFVFELYLKVPLPAFEFKLNVFDPVSFVPLLKEINRLLEPTELFAENTIYIARQIYNNIDLAIENRMGYLNNI